MYKKIIALLVVYFLALPIISSKSITEINEKDNLTQYQESLIGSDNKIVNESFEYKQEYTTDDGFSLFDIEIFASCWWSPNIWWESEGGLRCYDVYVEFNGWSGQSGAITINMYWVYEEREGLIKTINQYYGASIKWDYLGCTGYTSTEEKPVGIRAEVITPIGEITKNNNEDYSPIKDGVSIEGYFYEKNSEGELIPLINKMVYVSADIFYPHEEYSMMLTKHELFDWWNDGYFFLTAPVKPGIPPNKYKVKACYNASVYKIQKTEPLNAFESTTMDDFIYPFSKSGYSNQVLSLKFFNLFEKLFLKSFPLLQRLLKL